MIMFSDTLISYIFHITGVLLAMPHVCPPLCACRDRWEGFEPYSNVLWLHYLADKMVYTVQYPSQSARANRDVLRQFRQFVSTMLEYRSAMEMVADALFLNS